MEQQSSGFYVIDALSLKHKSKKPFHLDERIKARRTSRLTSSTSPSGATAPSLNPQHDDVLHSTRSNTSFMEARRSKLAKRHKHVKNVMSANLSKKSVLDSDGDVDGRRKIMETLDKAEKNRATLLDNQVKNNASKVARAKQIAAQQKHKTSEKTTNLRKELEDRLRASEARRRHLQSIPRSRLLDPTETGSLHKNIDPKETERLHVASATAIQNWWRLKAADKVIKEWKQADLSLERAKQLPFEKLIKVVQSKQVIRSATIMISYFKSFTSQLVGTTSVAWKNPARVFLSLYMIVAHTAQIMPTMGEDEEAVKSVASDLLTKFELWINTTSSPAKAFSVAATTELVSAWILYYNKFETWKERDTMKIVDGLISHYLELENLWLSVKDQIDADVQWKPRVEEQQQQIFARLQKFGDKAMERFSKARQDLHAQFGLLDNDEDLTGGVGQMSLDEVSASSGDERGGVTIPGLRRIDRSSSPSPSPSPSTSLLATSPQRFPGRVQQLMTATDSVSKPNVIVPQPTGRRSLTPTQRAGSRSASPAAANVILPQKPEVETPRLSTAPSTERLNSLSNMPGFGDMLTNEKLAHELTLDPEFSLKKPALSDLEASVREMARKAFFDQVRQDFIKGNFGTHVPEFLNDIKDQLIAMVSEKGKIAAEIHEALDIAYISHQIKNKTLNLPLVLQFIVSKMSQLCAPLRDAAIRKITTELSTATEAAAFVPIFDQILIVLDDMKLDLANYKLQTLRPHLKTQAVEYEKSKFRQSLAQIKPSNSNNNKSKVSELLPRTKTWLAHTTTQKVQTAKDRNPENIDLPENRVRYTDILHDALLGLVFSNSAVTPDTIAETLVMDGARVFSFQNEGQMIVIISALLMLVQNIVTEGRGDKAFLANLKDRLVAMLKAPEGLSVDNLALEIIASCDGLVVEKRMAKLRSVAKHEAVDTVEGLEESRKDLIRTMVDKTLSTKDPVFGLLKRRVQACIKTHVVSGSFKREGLDKAGLDVVRTELEAFSYRVAIWVRYNGEVYGEWYDEILNDLM